MTYQRNRNNPEESSRVSDPTRWCLGEVDEVLDSVPPDKGCAVLDGELIHE